MSEAERSPPTQPPAADGSSLSAGSRAQSLPIDIQKMRALSQHPALAGMRLGTPVDEATFLAMRRAQGLRAPVKVAPRPQPQPQPQPPTSGTPARSSADGER